MFTLEKPAFIDQSYDRLDPKYKGIITQYFGENKHPYYKSIGMLGHNGIDLGTITGQPIYASHDGEVIQISLNEKAGLGVKIVTHDAYPYQNRVVYFWTVEWHFSEVKVKVGDYVKAGDLVGLGGNTGISSGPHTHFALLPCYEVNNYYNKLFPDNGYNGYIDPLPFIKNMKKIIGDKSTGRQYLVGNDGLYRWIYNEVLLNELHNAGIADKTNVEWKDTIDVHLITNTWAVIK